MDYGNRIAEACLQHFRTLPKHGKPREGQQWTVLAAFIKEDKRNSLNVVALGTGTSCLGSSQMCKDGRIVHDAHAEVIARRAFIRYLYFELMKIHMKDTGTSTIFTLDKETGCCKLREGIRFHFYVTDPPCGDATIFPIMTTIPKEDGCQLDEFCAKRRKICENTISRDLLFNDTNRTGAKCVPGEKQDPHHTGSGYHEIGSLRTKPGRGERTHSMSCSDKIMRWNVMGWQGSLVNLFLSSPIYISVIVCGPNSNLSALERALVWRIDKPKIKALLKETKFVTSAPQIITSSCVFQYQKPYYGSDLKPCGSAVAWSDVPQNAHAVIAKTGFRLGTTRKSQHLPQASSCISRANLFELFMKIFSALHSNYLICMKILEQDSCVTYRDYKNLSEEYVRTWEKLRESCFSNWLKHNLCFDNFTV
ncbi:tRNA-specific adenosine deaminase 1-like [Clavelina lepadiformis]|uniref:tRNA-specific adenosine deaminase 1-like n=1 Tax=Clavelina lepadiformis TaxID=159417 RepID=UPI0040421634